MRINKHTNTYIHTYIHTYKLAYIHTYIHTYTYNYSGTLVEGNEEETEEQVTGSDGFVYSVKKGSPNKKQSVEVDGTYVHTYIYF